MDRTDLATICAAGLAAACRSPARPLASTRSAPIRGRLRAGDLFLALRGDKFDGHTLRSGSRAARRGGRRRAEHAPADLPESFAVIEVNEYAAGPCSPSPANYRRNLSLQVVGITGSSGKTSTKDLTAAVLGEHFQVLKTAGQSEQPYRRSINAFACAER